MSPIRIPFPFKCIDDFLSTQSSFFLLPLLLDRPTQQLVLQITLRRKSSFNKDMETNVIGGLWVLSCSNVFVVIHLSALRTLMILIERSWLGERL